MKHWKFEGLVKAVDAEGAWAELVGLVEAGVAIREKHGKYPGLVAGGGNVLTLGGYRLARFLAPEEELLQDIGCVRGFCAPRRKGVKK
jgi:hypothetical protein